MSEPDLTKMEVEVLRILNGEDVPGWVAGAAMWSCCTYLKGRGYAEGYYTISQKGRDYLSALPALDRNTVNGGLSDDE